MTPSLRAAVLALLALLSTGRSGHSEQPDIIRPLPPVDATEPQFPWAAAAGPRALLASDPQEYRMPEDVLPPQTPPLAAHKNGFFQKLSFTATEIFPDGGDGLGILETELFAAFALPAPTTDSPLVIVPTLEVQFPDSPAYAELPATLYATYLDLIWLPRISPRLQGILSVGAGCYSDFEGEDDGFRLTGRAIARYDWTPDRLQLVLGVLYINRYHTKLIPAAGVVWKPTDDLTFDLVFPQAKLARRLTLGAGIRELGLPFRRLRWQQLVDCGRGRRSGRADLEGLADHAGLGTDAGRRSGLPRRGRLRVLARNRICVHPDPLLPGRHAAGARRGDVLAEYAIPLPYGPASTLAAWACFTPAISWSNSGMTIWR